jgi:YD repeat-containing protein
MDMLSSITIETYAYDIQQNAIAHRDPNGNVTEHRRNAQGSVIYTELANGQGRRIVRDGFNQVTQWQDTGGHSKHYEYNKRGQVTHRFDEEGLEDQFRYDKQGQRIQFINGEGDTWRYAYDVQGHIVLRIEPTGACTRFEKDIAGRLLSEVRPGEAEGRTKKWTRDIHGNVLTHQDLGGELITYERDHLQQVRREYGQGGDHGKEYKLSGNYEAVANRNIQYIYDAAGHLVEIADDAVPLKSIYRIDAKDRRVEEYFSRSGHETTADTLYQASRIQYDALGRLSRVDDTRIMARYNYDPRGNRMLTRAFYHFGDGWSRIPYESSYTYDALNRILIYKGVRKGETVTLAPNQGLQIEYDIQGNRICETSIEPDGFELVKQFSYYRNRLLKGIFRKATPEEERESLEEDATHKHIQLIGIRYVYDKASRKRLQETCEFYLLLHDLKNDEKGIGYFYQVETFDYHLLGSIERQEAFHDWILAKYQPYWDGSAWIQQKGQQHGEIRTSAHWRDFNVWGNPEHQNRKTLPFSFERQDVVINEDVLIDYVYFDSPKISKIRHQVGIDGQGRPQYELETRASYDSNGYIRSLTGHLKEGFRAFMTNPEGRIVFKWNGEAGRELKRSYYFYDPYGHPIGHFGDFPEEKYLATLLEEAKTEEDLKVIESLMLSHLEAGYSSVPEHINFDLNITPIGNWSTVPPVLYTAQAGDTFNSIAEQFYGDESFGWFVAEYNGYEAGDSIPAQLTLRIPNPLPTQIHNWAGIYAPYSPPVGSYYPDYFRELIIPPPPPPPKRKWYKLVIRIAVTVAISILVPKLAPVLSRLLPTFLSQSKLMLKVLSASTAALANNAAQQALSLQWGEQEGFNLDTLWQDLLLEAVTEGVGGVIDSLPVSSLSKSQSAFFKTLNRLPHTLTKEVVRQAVLIALDQERNLSWESFARL